MDAPPLKDSARGEKSITRRSHYKLRTGLRPLLPGIAVSVEQGACLTREKEFKIIPAGHGHKVGLGKFERDREVTVKGYACAHPVRSRGVEFENLQAMHKGSMGRRRRECKGSVAKYTV